jgi:putative transposase
MPWTWPGGGANRPRPARWCTPTAARQRTSWLFGHWLRKAGLMGSMGAVGSAYDNALMESFFESFFGSMQIELLDRRTWQTRAELASAIFEWIEVFYNPIRRHSAVNYLSPIEHERLHAATETAA